ncbi:TIGR03885 family FMN-dependent LLM class oxidoreductase [Chitinophaga pinensis]|uniref:Luciferase-like monooxygenase n=1 Tax=Chitinophaga pinensis (strain ATCC 43595 / DSM 2588 / LMG 13176 / NBRC 15968 / NCIMB 11800 / UQM 2034) TaxID=485918 RepID=A0A979G7S1_CHIPD|nr:TIGR03885 family FMN-dependent LLM class oxidoreductase [Chitinophaga pinensis]ACU62459.1 Luciferase-like monooxygenase [Chitinophaga pinensis DSM 2588]
MAQITYHASHEQHPPSALLQYAIAAEQAGFHAVHSSDHFHPWSERQGQSGFSFSWIAAAMQATTLPFSMVCAPGQRYHPAIVAQAIATLGEMFPGRYSVELGSGEALNECITGDIWPHKEERNARLLECAQLIRRLLQGEMVTHNGLIRIKEAKLYTLPVITPPLMVAALSVKTAAWAGAWADGLITVDAAEEQLTQIVQAFRNNGGAGKPVYLQMAFSYAATKKEAMDAAYDQWRTNFFAPEVLNDLSRPTQFDSAADYVKPEDVAEKMLITDSAEECMSAIQRYVDLGFDRVILHNVHRDQERFIRDFGDKVLPHIRLPKNEKS